MSANTKFSIAVAAAAVIAIAAVGVPKIDSGGGDDSSAKDGPAPGEPAKPPDEAPERYEAPDDPDDVRGTHPRALTRAENLRRALTVLERRRRAVEGVYDGLRIAPGRIDTKIETRDRRTTLQVRSDLRVSFESAHDFPNGPYHRRTGLTALDIDVRAPASLLRRIDRIRPKSAERDIDYVVVGRDIIDSGGNLSAYMRSGPRPRAFVDEAGKALRAIG